MRSIVSRLKYLAFTLNRNTFNTHHTAALNIKFLTKVQNVKNAFHTCNLLDQIEAK